MDDASLDNLHDIVELPPVSWWPLAMGWWILMLICGAVLCVLAHRTWRKWRGNEYRRSALRSLATASTVREVDELLKRTALCVYPRNRVATLSGQAWGDWLQNTGGIGPIPNTVRQTLTVELFRFDEPRLDEETQKFAAEWINAHVAPDRKSEAH